MASTSNLSDKTTIVVGASRGLGRGIATALAEAGAPVTAVARSETALDDLARAVSGIRPEVTDAGDPSVAGNLIDGYDPHALVLVAGATPLQRPLHHQTWETFSGNWHTDVRISFHWVRETLLKPLRPGSRVVIISSGAALGAGSDRRRVRGRQSHAAIHRRLRPGGSRPSRSRDQVHSRVPGSHTDDRPRSPGGEGTRRPRRPD